MAEKFNPQKFDINSINGGNKYQNGYGLSADTINKVVEAAAYMQENGGGGSSVQFYQHRISNLADTEYQYVDIISTISEPFGKGENGYLSTENISKWYHMTCKSTTGDCLFVVGWVGPTNEAAVMYKSYTGGGHSEINIGIEFQETVTEYTL